MQTVLGWMFKWVLDWLYSTARDYIMRRQADKQAHDENTARAQDDHARQDKLGEQSTEKERDDATDDVLNRF